MTVRPQLRRDLQAVAVWAAALAVTWITLLVVSSVYGEVSVDDLAMRWRRWDFIHFDDIARLGYLPEPGTALTPAPLTAFLPGFPGLLGLGHLIGIPGLATGLVVSAIAGAVATVFIARLGEDRRAGAGIPVAAVFVFSPTAIFLFAPYTEALFLAFAIPAWYFATRGRWWLAALLASGAGLTRIAGVFLVIALVVLWCTQYFRDPDRRRRNPAQVLWLALPAGVIAGWMVVLFLMTGRPLEYLEAQAYWGRTLTDPISAIVTTWTAYAPSSSIWMRSAEIGALVVGVVTAVVLFVRRRFAEGTWIGLNAVVLGTSTYLYSVPRTSLVWWPLWIAVGTFLSSRRWLLVAYLLVSGTIMVLWDARFFIGAWAG